MELPDLLQESDIRYLARSPDYPHPALNRQECTAADETYLLCSLIHRGDPSLTRMP